jgi:peptidoglycan/LPS O-acetylase OafA/YrhL
MNEPKRYLPEIDGLRAVAVIAVIVSHFFEDWLNSGYLGVDIFFVISGFVITCHLRTVRPTSWKQYFSDFYAGRIKRIVPALLFCVFITNLLFLLLTTRPARGIFVTGGLSLLGLSNIYLFKNSTDYFSLDAKLNPFTHTWSLGVEEQFYLFFPLLFALAGFVPSIGKRCRHGTFFLVALAATSFLFYLAIFHVSENAAYYLIPSRIWELSVGALTFLLYERKERLRNWRIPSLWVFIPLLLVLTSSAIHQTVITTACVGLTSLVLFFINPGDVTHRLLTMRPLIFVGLLSYSLYLWHWTILVLGKWTLGTTPVAKGVLLAAVFACAMFSYFLIEKPLRYKPWSGSSFTTISYGAIAAVFVASLSIFVAPRFGMDYNNFVSSAFGIEHVEDWSEKLPCYTEAVHVRFKDPYEECLSATRTAEKPHDLPPVVVPHPLLV